MSTTTQTKPRSMLRVRQMEERDIEVLENLWRNTGSDELVFPTKAFTTDHLVLEDESGRVRMALFSGLAWFVVPIIDPSLQLTEEEWEKFKSLVAATESNMARNHSEGVMAFYVPKVYKELVRWFNKFSVPLKEQFVPFGHFLKPEAQREKNQ